MRSVEYTTSFKKCIKRVLAGRYRDIIEEELPEIIHKLASDVKLPGKYKDHSLTGNWINHRDCHIRPDLILIYRKIGEKELYLVEIGSHSEIFG